MGWDFLERQHSPQTLEQERAQVTRDLTYRTPSHKSEVVQASKKGSVWYVAQRITLLRDHPLAEVYEPDADGTFSIATIIITQRYRGAWGYKDLSEQMGPYYWDAPKSLIAKLSKLKDNEAAQRARDWREQCEKARWKPKFGDVIRLASPVTVNGHETQTLRCTFVNRRGRRLTCFSPVDANVGTPIRLPRHLIQESTLVEPA